MRLEDLVADVSLRFLLWGSGLLSGERGLWFGRFWGRRIGGYCGGWGDRGSTAGDVGWGEEGADRDNSPDCYGMCDRSYWAVAYG
jgi:hypothetical protein